MPKKPEKLMWPMTVVLLIGLVTRFSERRRLAGPTVLDTFEDQFYFVVGFIAIWGLVVAYIYVVYCWVAAFLVRFSDELSRKD